MKKKKYLFLIILLLTGCTPHIEINKLGIVDILAIEKKETAYLATVHFINNINSSTPPLKSHGTSIIDCLENISLKTNKKIYLSHINTLLLNEEIIKEDLKPLINYFLKSNEARNTFTPILLKNTEVSVLLNKMPKDTNLNDYLEISRQELGLSFTLTFEEFARDYLSETNSNLLPVIKVEDDLIEMDSYAYFKNKIFENYLTKDEALTYNLLKNKNSPLKLALTCSKKISNIKIKELDTTISSHRNNLALKIKGTYEILDNPCHYVDKTIEEKIKEQLTIKIKHLIEKEKKEEIDFLGLTNLIYNNNYLYYKKNKKDLLKTITTNIKIDLIKEKRKSFD